MIEASVSSILSSRIVSAKTYPSDFVNNFESSKIYHGSKPSLSYVSEQAFDERNVKVSDDSKHTLSPSIMDKGSQN